MLILSCPSNDLWGLRRKGYLRLFDAQMRLLACRTGDFEGVPMKDNLFANRTLWLDSDHMAIARERFFNAWFVQSGLPIESVGHVAALRKQWEMAWAAGIAAYSFCAEGNLGQPVGNKPESAVDST